MAVGVDVDPHRLGWRRIEQWILEVLAEGLHSELRVPLTVAADVLDLIKGLHVLVTGLE